MENHVVPTNHRMFEPGKVTVVLGIQWGDEGKGKMVDLLAAEADLICRFQGGFNAAHTVVADGHRFDFHILPSGMLHPKCAGLLGNGMALHLPSLMNETVKYDASKLPPWKDRLFISNRAHLVFDFHENLDKLQEVLRGSTKIGTTKAGIGPTYSSKASRNGLRVCDLMDNFEIFSQRFRALVDYHLKIAPQLLIDVEEELNRYKTIREHIRPMVVDNVYYLNKCLEEGKNVLIEGAQSTILDLDLGLYPCVTSSNCSIGGVCPGLGIPPTKVGKVFGVVKAYLTRLGTGGFPTEFDEVRSAEVRDLGWEYTQDLIAPLRIGWLDTFMLRYSHLLNNVTGIALTKLDILDTFEEIKIGVGYSIDGKRLDTFPVSDDQIRLVTVEYITMPGWMTSTTHVRKPADLPENALKYVRKIEELVGVPVWWIGVGASRDSIVRMY